MTSTRVLIVEPDHPFGLSLASLFQEEGHATRVAGSAGEAELEIATRRPDLVVLRAELPDLSGFSLCARLRHDRATARLPVILYSSDTAPGALAEHASTPWAANGYLAMPLDTAALRSLSRRILATAAEGVESADDAVIEEGAPEPPPPPPAPEPPPGAPVHTPPPMPRRPVRNALTEEDRLLVGRIFASIADRRDALLAEASRTRPPPRRDLLQSPEGRIQLLREDLKVREGQIAQLAELWEIREREVEYAGEWLHEKDVELQGLKGQVEDLLGRLAEARESAARKEREHAAAVDGLLLEKVSQEKELIEAVAAGERKIHEAERRHEAARRALEEAIQALEAEKRALEERLAAGAAELAAERERAGSLEAELGEARAAAEAAGAEAGRREAELRGEVEGLRADVEERDRLLAAAKRENDRLQAGLTAARHEQMVAMSELDAANDRLAALAARLAAAERERDAAWASLAVAPAPGAGAPGPGAAGATPAVAEAAPAGGAAADPAGPPGSDPAGAGER